MKSKFFHHYRPTKEEFADLWQSCTFVLDANVLLSVYRYSKVTREDLLQVIERLPPRLWIPHQFALEYHENRIDVLVSQIKSHSAVEKQLKEILAQRFEPRYKHLAISPHHRESLKGIIAELEDGRKEHESLLTDDPYQARISKVFEGRVGEPPSATALVALHQEAKNRYQSQIPPGFADLKEKGEPRAFGDYIAWTQILDYAKSHDRSVILVTDDRKADWWLNQEQWTIGPRLELIQEFRRECNGMFYMYTPDQFIRLAGVYLEQSVRDETITEIKEQAKAQQISESALKPGGVGLEQGKLGVVGLPVSSPDEAKVKPVSPEVEPKVSQHSGEMAGLKPVLEGEPKKSISYPKVETDMKSSLPIASEGNIAMDEGRDERKPSGPTDPKSKPSEPT